MSIFIQIASYRDRELIPTIKDIIAKSKYPNDLTFGICWQHDGSENLNEFLNDKRFRILSVDWSNSKGCCWARNKTQKLYEGEDYTLQIDSHLRFIHHWDDELIQMIQCLNDNKPILSYYPPEYFIKTDGSIELSNHIVPQELIVNKFESDFIPYFGSTSVHASQTKPTLGRFLAAGMIFTIGKFCEEILYNPNIYFLGEEIDLALRSYTHGYNIYHPSKSVCWHYFIRKGEPRHWEDHNLKAVERGDVKIDYVTTTMKGFEKLKLLLWEDNADLGLYSLGKIRSRRDFELFAGLNFKRRILHPDHSKKAPPITDDNNWEEKYVPPVPFKQTIKLDLTKVPILDDYDFWYFGLHDSNYIEVYRKDFKISDYLIDRKDTVDIDTVCDRKPLYWILWPVSKSKGWLEKIVVPI